MLRLRSIASMLLGVLFVTAAMAEPTTRPAGLMEARKGYKTVVRSPEAAGQRKPNPPIPPATEYTLVRYSSPAGVLDAYLSARPKDTKKHPAVIWAKGGYGGLGIFWESEPADNDQTPQAFKDAGCVVMIPAWRGQGRNPGKFEKFYGEVDDALAAIDYVAKLPYVDSSRIYMVGHSTGGTMVLLTAEASTKLRAAFSLGGAPDVQRWVTHEDDHSETPFDYNDAKEGQLRSAINFVSSLQTPTWYFEGDSDALRSFYCGDALKMGRIAEETNTPFHPFILDGGTHFTIVRPVTQLIAQKIIADTGPSCGITISSTEIVAAWKKVFAGKPLAAITPAVPDVQITEQAITVFNESTRHNGMDPAATCLFIGLAQGRVNVGIDVRSKIPEPDFVIVQSRGIAVAVDARIADQYRSCTIDVVIDRAARQVSFAVRPNPAKK